MNRLLSLLLIAFALPELALGGDCPLDRGEREKIAAILASLPEVPYSHRGFRDPATEYAANFDPHARVGDLLNAEGRLFLFRNIGAPYIRGFTGGGRGFIESEHNGYSYSLSPAIIYLWTNDAAAEPYTLIAFQGLEQDALFYNRSWVLKPGETPPTGSNVYLEHPMEGMTIVHTFPPLQTAMAIAETGGYHEVKVPVPNENVLILFPQREFKRIMDEFGNAKFTLRTFLARILESEEAESPRCSPIAPRD